MHKRFLRSCIQDVTLTVLKKQKVITGGGLDTITHVLPFTIVYQGAQEPIKVSQGLTLRPRKGARVRTTPPYAHRNTYDAVNLVWRWIFGSHSQMLSEAALWEP